FRLSRLPAAGVKRVPNFSPAAILEMISALRPSAITTATPEEVASFAASDIAIIKGIHSKSIADTLGYDYGSEVIHRNNLVIL
ncbi:glutamate 5-kinase, partial [Chloroflexota bacterium]